MAAEDALRAWIGALHALTRTPDDAAQFRETRTQFAVAVAREALQVAGTAKAPAVYGVWLDGHGEPVYVGQTLDAGRRLWDLPIGESHHLANTYPPEIWSRIVVVRWLDILRSDPRRQAALLAELQGMSLGETQQLRAIGLMLEHRLQLQLRPRFNATKRKSRAGGWREVDRAVSRSLGAVQVDGIDWLSDRVAEVWQFLSAHDPPQQTSAAHPLGAVVLPSRIRQAWLDAANQGW